MVSLTQSHAFHEDVSTKLADLEKRTKVMEESFKEVLLLYGEDTEKTQPEEFFAIVKTFVQLFETAKKQNEDRARQEEVQRKRQEANEEKEARRVAKEQAKEQAKENVKNPSLDSDGQFFLPFPFSPLFTKDERTTLILVAHVTRR